VAYTVKEIFKSLQGEGARTGRVSVFCRFAGCNLWSGRERDRSRAVCQFCDTDFINGVRFARAELVDAIDRAWGDTQSERYVIFTGGEPALQLDPPLIAAIKARGFAVAIETNGTIPVPSGIDWITVSPKAGAFWVQRRGDELKLVYPQNGLLPADIEPVGFAHFYLQPMDGPERAAHTKAAIAYCLQNPRWQLSLQTHKLLGIR
jgi:7-carboxy-7-deazaguanine synthase